MLLSVSTWSVHNQLYNKTMSKEEFVKLLHIHEITGMEVVNSDFQDASFESMKELRDIGKRYGIEITCMALEHDLCQYTEQDRQNDVERVIKWMEIAKRLNVFTVRIHTGWYKEGIPYHMQMKWVYEGVERILKRAEELDINLVLENHNNICFGADEIVELIGDMRSKYLHACPDIYNYKIFFNSETPCVGEWCYDEVEKMLPCAKNVHIKVYPIAEVNKDYRYLDIEKMYNLLGKYGYDGPVVLEFGWPFLKEGMNYIKELENAIEVLKHQMKVNIEIK